MTRRGYETGEYRTISNFLKDKKKCSGATTFFADVSLCRFCRCQFAMFFVFTCDALVCFSMFVYFVFLCLAGFAMGLSNTTCDSIFTWQVFAWLAHYFR